MYCRGVSTGFLLDPNQRSMGVIFRWVNGEAHDVRIVDYR